MWEGTGKKYLRLKETGDLCSLQVLQEWLEHEENWEITKETENELRRDMEQISKNGKTRNLVLG